MNVKDLDFGMYVSHESYRGIAFWVDDWSKKIVDQYVEYPDFGDSGEPFYGWEEVEIVSDSMVDCYMIGDDRKFEFDLEELTVIDINTFCSSCGQIGCGHG